MPSERMLTTTGSYVQPCSERHFRPSPLGLPSRALSCNEFNAGKNNTGGGQVPRAGRPPCPRWNCGQPLATVPFPVFTQVLQSRKTTMRLLKSECPVTRAHTYASAIR